MKNLPIGIQTFSEIVNNSYLYVDKTKDILELLESGKYFFISRPRRFGKSLIVSTLNEIFCGNRALFKGLHIFDRWKWKPCPVLLLDFTIISHNNVTILRKSLLSFIEDRARHFSVELSREGLAEKFSELIEKIASLTGSPVVVLVDEYDRPITDHVDHKEIAGDNRDILREFYSVLKGSDQYLKFVFFAGVSKFSKVSVFSGLNNLNDITLDERFATLAGITEEELHAYFEPYLKALEIKENLTRPELAEKIRHWYNGYSWDGLHRVYNPFSLLKLFYSERFSTYWFATGTPSFLVKLLREEKFEIPRLDGCAVSEYLFESYDFDSIDISALLFQTGYLTIKKMTRQSDVTLFHLGFPDYEVKESLMNYLLADYLEEKVSRIQPAYLRIKEHMTHGETLKAMKLIKSLCARIPYTLHIKKEAYYHSLFYMIFALLGMEFKNEVMSDRGRLDGVLELAGRVYIIEFKYGTKKTAMDALTARALGQIKKKRYYESFLGDPREIILLAIGVIDREIGFREELLLPGEERGECNSGER